MKKTILLVLLIICGLTITSAQSEQQADFSIKKFPTLITAGETVNIVLSVNISEGWHINSVKPNDEYLIPTKITVNRNDFSVKGVKFPEAKNLKFKFSDKPVAVYEGEFEVTIIVEALPNIKPGNEKIGIVMEYQSCNNSSCMPPNEIKKEFSVKIENRMQDAGTKQDTTIKSNESVINEVVKKETNVNSEQENTGLAERALLLNILFVFLGGLALNLTPCVYPLIPITVGYFGGQSEGKTSKLFLLGLFYVLGMALTYSVVGVVTSLSGAVFGSLMQNPIVIILITMIFIALALSMFGLYELKMPDSWVMKAGGAKSGVFGAFFMGLTMGIVAAPCIGPFVLSLVTFVAAKGDPFYGFIMFFFLAVGLGTPYLILAVFSGKLKSLPRAGFWMNAVKHIFGFIMLGMALYFAAPLMPKNISSFILPIYMMFSAIYLLFFDKLANNVRGFRIFKIVFSVLVIIVSAYMLWPVEKKSPEWVKYEQEKFDNSISQNKKIIMDFYADWCIPCKEFDALTFSDKNVITFSKEFDNYKVDMTKNNDTNNMIREKFGVKGMPTIIFFNSEGKEQTRLTGFVSAEEFLKVMKSIK